MYIEFKCMHCLHDNFTIRQKKKRKKKLLKASVKKKLIAVYLDLRNGLAVLLYILLSSAQVSLNVVLHAKNVRNLNKKIFFTNIIF